MWYKIDMTKLVVQLLPPILRSKFLTALMKVLITPFAFIYDRMLKHRDNVSERLDITANVIYLEKVMNDTFFLKENQIYIETQEEDLASYWYFKHNEAPYKYLQKGTKEGIYMKCKEEGSYKVSFIVYVPTFLCTSLDQAVDKYKGKNLTRIKELLSFYKPAGRTCSIILYDYE